MAYTENYSVYDDVMLTLKSREHTVGGWTDFTFQDEIHLMFFPCV